MAGSTSAHIKNLRDQSTIKDNQFTKHHIGNEHTSERKIKGNSRAKSEVAKYEERCRNWSIISNVAAVVSVAGAVYSLFINRNGLFSKRNRWF